MLRLEKSGLYGQSSVSQSPSVCDQEHYWVLVFVKNGVLLYGSFLIPNSSAFFLTNMPIFC